MGKKQQKAAAKKWTTNPKLDAAYAEAQAKGPAAAEKFLKTHPVFAKKVAGSTTPPKSGTKGSDKVTVPAASGPAKKILKASDQFAADDIRNQQQATNADTTDIYGNTSGVTYDAEGKPHFTSTLGASQQQILNQGQANAQAGQTAAGNLLGGYNEFSFGGDDGTRQRVEDALYARLTKNVDRDYANELDAMEQRMYNRGIPLDPSNPAYKREMDALNEKYTGIKENAANNAVAQGSAEYQAEYGRQLGQHQQGISDISSLQSQGIGLQAPQTGTFQAGTWDTQTPAQTELELKNQATQKAIAEIQARTAMGVAGINASAGDEEEEASPPT